MLRGVCSDTLFKLKAVVLGLNYELSAIPSIKSETLIIMLELTAADVQPPRPAALPCLPLPPPCPPLLLLK